MTGQSQGEQEGQHRRPGDGDLLAPQGTAAQDSVAVEATIPCVAMTGAMTETIFSGQRHRHEGDDKPPVPSVPQQAQADDEG